MVVQERANDGFKYNAVLNLYSRWTSSLYIFHSIDQEVLCFMLSAPNVFRVGAVQCPRSVHSYGRWESRDGSVEPVFPLLTMRGPPAMSRAVTYREGSSRAALMIRSKLQSVPVSIREKSQIGVLTQTS